VGLSVEKKSEVKEGNIIYIWTHTLWLLLFCSGFSSSSASSWAHAMRGHLDLLLLLLEEASQQEASSVNI